MTFKELGLHHFLLRAIEEIGYDKPTKIQSEALPHALKGHDILGLAQTGSGKTASFALPILQSLYLNRKSSKDKSIRSLILSPTRELAIQIHESFENYGKHLPLSTAVIFGGVKQGNQVREIRKGVDILVATPGRLLDLMGQGIIDISKVEIFVLDEADRMLDMGFIHDIRKVLKSLPRKKQTMLFSATMPKEIKEIVDDLLKDPVQVRVNPVHKTVDSIQQYAVYVDNSNKVDYLVDYIKNTTQESMLLFTRTKRGSDKVVKDLVKRGITAQAIHGNKSQMARTLALENFKNYEVQVLVATDIASRGIDINELGYVINYDMPEVPETYVHRIGRTGRAGKSGVAISLVSFNDIEYFKNIETHTKQKIEVLTNEKYPLVDKSPKAKPKQRPSKKSGDSKPSNKTKKDSNSKDSKKKDEKKDHKTGEKDWRNHNKKIKAAKTAHIRRSQKSKPVSK